MEYLIDKFLDPELSNEFCNDKFYALVHYFRSPTHRKTATIEVFTKKEKMPLMLFSLHEEYLNPVQSLPSSIKTQYDLHDQVDLLDFIASVQENILDNFYHV